MSFKSLGGNTSLLFLKVEGLFPFFGFIIDILLHAINNVSGACDAYSIGSNGILGGPEISHLLQRVLVELSLLVIAEACFVVILVIWNWVNSSESFSSASKTLGSFLDLSKDEWLTEMSSEVKNLASAGLLTVGNVTFTGAVFTVISAQIWYV